MAEVCPGAWLLNYTNPLAMICQLVYQRMPQTKVVGLCHSVQGTMEEANPDLLRRVRVDMYLRLGYFPTESSEHSAEYSPWYMRHDSEIERLRIPIADHVGRSAAGVEEYEHVKQELAEGTGRTFSNVCDLTVRAVLEGGLDHVRHAALLDPNTAASLTLDEIDTLVAELLDAYRDLLRESLR
jgi:alpha-galactosidase/6-phospho-beta-glucosidase family protein